MIKIAPSLLSADFSDLRSELKDIEKAGADWLHLDIMDGHFVPNITFGPPVIKKMRPHSKLFFDAHLMIENPDLYLKDFQEAGVDLITVHAETGYHLHRTIQNIKSLGLKAGVSLNPSTSENVLDYIIDDLDLVLIMSVNPGFGGQSFIEETLEKIKNVRKMIDSRKLKTEIQVDGGIKAENIKKVFDAGANVFVAGSAVFGQKDRKEAIANLKKPLLD